MKTRRTTTRARAKTKRASTTRTRRKTRKMVASGQKYSSSRKKR